jgi:hypothetical protein
MDQSSEVSGVIASLVQPVRADSGDPMGSDFSSDNVRRLGTHDFAIAAAKRPAIVVSVRTLGIATAEAAQERRELAAMIEGGQLRGARRLSWRKRGHTLGGFRAKMSSSEERHGSQQ